LRPSRLLVSRYLRLRRRLRPSPSQGRSCSARRAAYAMGRASTLWRASSSGGVEDAPAEEWWKSVRTMGLASMRHDKTTRMPVVSLSKAKSTHVVNAAGESNAAPGITEVKRSAFRVDMHLEYQNLVIMPRTTEVTAVASSKLGQSSTDDGCWLTRTKQTGVTVLVKGALQTLLVTRRSASGITMWLQYPPSNSEDDTDENVQETMHPRVQPTTAHN